MSIRFTDSDIQAFLQEAKPLPSDFSQRLAMRSKRGHKEQELQVTGTDGNEFKVLVRQSLYNPVDFSVILAVCPKASNLLFRLRRHNGKSHEHTNQIEGDTFYDFHVHMATERYQSLGSREDAYAEPTSEYGSVQDAIWYMLNQYNFELPSGFQSSLFGGAQ